MEHAAAQPGSTATGRSAVYVGGPIYPTNPDAAKVVADLSGSGFTTVFLWSIHVWCSRNSNGVIVDHDDNGDLYYNDVRIVHHGNYVGHADWPEMLKKLKSGQSTVKRIEVSVGAGGTKDWEGIKYLIEKSGGDKPEGVLYKNFKALREKTGAVAVNDDDESAYNVSSTVKFANMVKAIGYENFTIVPFERKDFWTQVKKQLGTFVDRAYVQCYSGGSRNASADALKEWSEELGGMNVDPGLWCKHIPPKGGSRCTDGDTPDQVKNKLSSWRGESAPIEGGFIWLYDDIKKCGSLKDDDPKHTAKDYATAVNDATKAKTAAVAR
jgi:hypothetical protein